MKDDIQQFYERQGQISQVPKTAPSGKQRKKLQSTASKKKQFQIPDIILVESSVFPAIYFAKTSLRNLLKDLVFPDKIQPLQPDDDRIQLIFLLISKLFYEIKLYIFNLLVCQHKITGNYLIFFSDADQIPFSKCCNAPIYVELGENGTGKLKCNSSDCSLQVLTEFLINFDDAQKLWKGQILFRRASNKDKLMRSRISKLITTGKYRHHSLAKEIKKTSKEIAQLFDRQNRDSIIDEDYDILEQGEIFMTNVQERKTNQNQNVSANEFGDQNLEQKMCSGEANNTHQEKNTQKDKYELFNYKKKLSEGLVMSSKIFNKQFQFRNAFQPCNDTPQYDQQKLQTNTMTQLPSDNIQQPTLKQISSNGINIRLKKSQIQPSMTQKSQMQFQQQNQQKYIEDDTLMDIKNLISNILEDHCDSKQPNEVN